MQWRVVETPQRLAQNPGGPLRFRARIKEGQDDAIRPEMLVRAYCYRACEGQDLRKGAEYTAVMSLLPPDYAENPSAFDYAAWLADEGIGAIAQVRTQPELLIPPGWLHRLHRSALDSLEAVTRTFTNQSMLLALLTGQRERLAPQQRQLLIETATMHLLVVSGMHLGLAFALCLLLLRLAGASLRTQLLGAALVMLVYVWLADFGAPAVRALVMASIAAWLLMQTRQMNVWFAWLAALLLVAGWQTAFWRDAGVALSFSAVAILLRLSGGWRSRHWLWSLIEAQWVLFILLGLLQALLFHRLSPSAFAANLLLIPLVSLALLPLTLLGSLASLFTPMLAWPFFALADLFASFAWWWLEWLRALPFASMRLSGELLADWRVMGGCALLAATLLLPPAFVWGRLMALLALLPLVWWQAEDSPAPLLLATRKDIYVLVRDQERMLVVAATQGDKPSASDLRYVLAPALRHAKVRRIDWLALNRGASRAQIDGELRRDQRLEHLEYCRIPPGWPQATMGISHELGCALELDAWTIAPSLLQVGEMRGLISGSEAYALAVASGVYRLPPGRPCVLIGRNIPDTAHCARPREATRLWKIEPK